MSTTVIKSSGAVAVGVALAWAAHKLNANAVVHKLLPAPLHDAALQLAIVCVLAYLTATYLTTGVGRVRALYNIQPPITYPTEKDLPNHKSRTHFLAAVRGHENYLESNAQVFFAYLVSYVLKLAPSLAFVLVVTHLISRIIYSEVYQLGARLRIIGFAPSFLAVLTLHGLLALEVAKRFGIPTYL